MIGRIVLSSSILLLALALSVVAALCAGSVWYSPLEAVSFLIDGKSFPSEFAVLAGIRLPRIVLSVLVGGALSASGAAFQALLRNPLADPYIVGTSSGAALGAAVAIVLNVSAAGIFSPITLFAFVGSGVVMLCVYWVSLRNGRLSVESFLLSGVIAGAFCGALVSFLMVFAGKDLHHIVWWLMGGFAGREDWDYVLLILPYFIAGVSALAFLSPSLNLFSMGEEIAASRGVDVERAKFMIIASASLLTAAAVSVAGTIGFVGFMIPHAVRRLFGSEHRILMITSVLGGGVFLLCADTLARCVLAGGVEIPVGIITSLCGAPFFFFVLKNKR